LLFPVGKTKPADRPGSTSTAGQTDRFPHHGAPVNSGSGAGSNFNAARPRRQPADVHPLPSPSGQSGTIHCRRIPRGIGFRRRRCRWTYVSDWLGAGATYRITLCRGDQLRPGASPRQSPSSRAKANELSGFNLTAAQTRSPRHTPLRGRATAGNQRTTPAWGATPPTTCSSRCPTHRGRAGVPEWRPHCGPPTSASTAPG